MPFLALLFLFVAVPILEIYVIIQVGQAIGALWTIALLIADSILGSLLMRSQGRAAWRRFQLALSEGRVPAREVVDGVLVIFGGAFLLTPGFCSDVVGALLLLPPTRALIRRGLVRRFGFGMFGAIPGVRVAGGARQGGRRPDDQDVEGTATEIDPQETALNVTVDHEAPRELAEGQSDAVTVAFSDPEADVCGVARIGRAVSDGEEVTSGLAILFAGGQPVAVRAEGGVPSGEGVGWGRAEAAGVWTEVVDPLRAWRVHFDDEDGAHSFLLDLESVSTPAVLDGDVPAGKLGGMEGYDQLVKVTGTVTVGGVQRTFAGRGQRGHSWGAPDWDKLGLARTLGVWLEGDAGVTLTAVRPAKASSHADEAIHAVLLGRDGETDEQLSLVVADPRVSTTYDSEGRQRHAGLELYETDEAPYARRAAGEVACGTTLDLGRLRLDCAFFTWRMEGRSGVGRYDVLRRVEG